MIVRLPSQYHILPIIQEITVENTDILNYLKIFLDC